MDEGRVHNWYTEGQLGPKQSRWKPSESPRLLILKSSLPCYAAQAGQGSPVSISLTVRSSQSISIAREPAKPLRSDISTSQKVISAHHLEWPVVIQQVIDGARAQVRTWQKFIVTQRQDMKEVGFGWVRGDPWQPPESNPGPFTNLPNLTVLWYLMFFSE